MIPERKEEQTLSGKGRKEKRRNEEKAAIFF